VAFVQHPSPSRNSARRKGQAFAAACAALKHVYHPALAIGLDKLTPRRRWQLACRFRKACTKADWADADGADICRAVVGRTNLLDPLVCGAIETFCAIDERAEPPEHTDSVAVVVFDVIVDRRAEIRKRPLAIAGPPPPYFNDIRAAHRRPRFLPGAPVLFLASTHPGEPL
jgi:hypothetical protein